TAEKEAMLGNIRDHTLPYVIRATATLLHWFAAQLHMPEQYRLWTVGASGYSDFFTRDTFTRPFPATATQSGTVFNKQAGDALSLRAHINPHPQSSAKFRLWQDDNGRSTVEHQWDDYVLAGQEDVFCNYFESHSHNTPDLLMTDELGNALGSDYPLFKNPWQVDPSRSSAWTLEQPDRFEPYRPVPAMDANGGIFLNIYDALMPPEDYYSIRASLRLEQYAKTHKSGALDAGDYAFLGWEPVYADLLPDPKNTMWPPLPAYSHADEYDTKLVDFHEPHAMVLARYKKHRSSDLPQAPTQSNSQRKVARDPQGIYHAAYESGNRIWYVSSSDRGLTWSNEQCVSDPGRQATRPAVASIGGEPWIAYLSDGEVVVRLYELQQWKTVYSVPVAMADCTPAIAALGSYEGAVGNGPVLCLVWEEAYELRFTVLQDRVPIIDNQVLAHGNITARRPDQPRFPSVAASTMTPSIACMDYGFHIAWIENGSVFYVKLMLDRRQHPVRIWGWQPGGAQSIETVQSRTGTVGTAYPAKHAPSIAVTDLGAVFVAYDVQSWYSPWPASTLSVTSPAQPGVSLGGMFAVRQRSLPSLPGGPSWQTTTTLVGGSISSGSLCSPSIGAQPGRAPRGGKTNSVRVVYNDSNGQLRVARFDGSLLLLHHAEGWDPSLTVWSPVFDGLLDVFSYDAQRPYTWQLRASRSNLARRTEHPTLRMRQILLRNDASFASFGMAQPRLRNADGGVQELDWNEAHDSLVIGINTTVAEKMRTEVFTPEADAVLLVDIERFGVEHEDSRAEILLNVNDARSGEVLRVETFPLNGFASAAALAVREVDLSMLAGTEVFVTADMFAAEESWEAAVTDRYATAVENADDGIETHIDAGTPQAELLRNHPNPFNPSTRIRYRLPEAGMVRVSVYNLLGVEVTVLQEDRQEAGRHEVQFDASGLPSGVYLYRLDVDGNTQTRSMHLIK
ncbi:MAG: T9SS type A sorting domain-containing protein, partial [Bacteroidetes bacterium]|nr:T9SS type A sorting domain-containing protein [Bacteroidota bacterium]